MGVRDIDVLATLPRTRREILTLLKRRGRATIAELAQILGMTHEGVRSQIVQLQSDGLIDDGCETTDAPGDGQTAGRPPAYYCLTTVGDHVFPKRYDALALLLIEAAGVGENLLANVTDARVEALEIPRRGTLRARLEALASVYLDHDPYVEIVRRGDDWVLIERNCPFLNIALERPALCSTTVSVMRRILGCEVVRERRFQDGDGRCEFRVLADRPLDPPPRFAPEPPKDAAAERLP